MLLEEDAVAEDGDVVIGGKQRDQADGGAAEHLEKSGPIEAQPLAGEYRQFWRLPGWRWSHRNRDAAWSGGALRQAPHWSSATAAHRWRPADQFGRHQGDDALRHARSIVDAIAAALA
mgnify:CR=1 FL=1